VATWSKGDKRRRKAERELETRSEDMCVYLVEETFHV